jgi:hypothetical protein
LQLRVGDLTLYSEEKGGRDFFARLKSQLDRVLAATFPVHFYFFAEAPGTETDTRSAQEEDDGKEGEVRVRGCSRRCCGVME